MARIRTIKPEFWASEQVAECSPNARLMFVGLWNFADDGGVIPRRPMQIKMQVFPGDAFTKEDIEGWIEELVNAGLLLAYSSQSVEYLWVTGWDKHQRIDHPTHKYPRPFQEPSEDSPNVRRTLAPDRKGKEGIGKESPPTPQSQNEEPNPPTKPQNVGGGDEWEKLERAFLSEGVSQAHKAVAHCQRLGLTVKQVRALGRHHKAQCPGASGGATYEFFAALTKRKADSILKQAERPP